MQTTTTRCIAMVLLVAVTAAAAVLGALTAVSGPVSGAAPGAALHSAASATEAAGSATLTLSLRTQASATGANASAPVVVATGRGAVDFAHNASKLHVDFTGLHPLGQRELDEIDVANTLYASVPAVGELVPGKSWVQLPGGELSSLLPTLADPAAMLRLVAADLSSQVVAVGQETVDGASTTHYRITISAADVDHGVSSGRLSPEVAQVAHQLLQGGAQGTAVLDAWIDASNRLRRLEVQLPLAFVSTTTLFVVDLSHYGESVEVNAPPADQIATLGDLVAGTGNAIARRLGLAPAG